VPDPLKAIKPSSTNDREHLNQRVIFMFMSPPAVLRT
jgi:hypothetical protein